MLPGLTHGEALQIAPRGAISDWEVPVVQIGLLIDGNFFFQLLLENLITQFACVRVSAYLLAIKRQPLMFRWISLFFVS